MSNVFVPFMRIHGCHRPQWYVADIPFASIDSWKVNNPDPFILVKVEAETIPEEFYNNPNIRLKIDSLQGRFPDEIITVKDINGNDVESLKHGPFSEKGKTDLSHIPTITIKDVETI